MGVLLGILSRGVRLSSPNPDPISDLNGSKINTVWSHNIHLPDMQRRGVPPTTEFLVQRQYNGHNSNNLFFLFIWTGDAVRPQTERNSGWL